MPSKGKVAPAPARSQAYTVAEQRVAEAEDFWRSRRSSEGSFGDGVAQHEPYAFAKSAKTVMRGTMVKRQVHGCRSTSQGALHPHAPSRDARLLAARERRAL